MFRGSSKRGWSSHERDDCNVTAFTLNAKSWKSYKILNMEEPFFLWEKHISVPMEKSPQGYIA